MLFKQPELELEFWRAEPKVIAIALYCEQFSLRSFGHPLLVTDVDRSQAEYDAIYPEAIERGLSWTDAAGVRHYAGPMPHLYDKVRNLQSRAVDFGILRPGVPGAGRLGLSNARSLADHLNAEWRRKDGKKTALIHDVGSGEHLHIQAEV